MVIAMGNGADVALDPANVVLPDGDLRLVVRAVRLSTRTVRIIWPNRVWAFVYNILALPLAAFGLMLPIVASGRHGVIFYQCRDESINTAREYA